MRRDLLAATDSPGSRRAMTALKTWVTH